ncbi:MAG: helix-turn-helix transcriptional regulator [Candidatus Sericytochromatia bacterium]|nr:helix-turn-helix transcriptional regulator [Candidatus Sericytochromatia bacterium]
MSKLRTYITARRQELRLSQRQLAAICELPLGTVAGIESGREVTAPRPATLEKLARGLKTSYARLDAMVRGAEAESLGAMQRWEEDYYYRMFDQVMTNPAVPETERLLLLAKLRTVWQTHGDHDLPL